ncbi:MAG TPA: hypothetical protein VE029_06045, partial [Rhizobacter sp.]|nr:hypothetical protein [Rhizobacter sp.]
DSTVAPEKVAEGSTPADRADIPDVPGSIQPAPAVPLPPENFDDLSDVGKRGPKALLTVRA